MVKGARRDGLYLLHCSHQALAASSTTLPDTIWHNRLGHPSSSVLSKLVNGGCISPSSCITNICTSCQMGKAYRLPFSLNHKRCNSPFI